MYSANSQTNSQSPALPATPPHGRRKRTFRRVLSAILPVAALGNFLLAAPVKPAIAAPLAGDTQTVETTTHTFVYVADHPVKSITLAGTFNNWNRTSTPLTVGTDGKTWQVTLTLPYGQHWYKFVLDGDNWQADPTAKGTRDGDGNSPLLLLPPDYATPARPDDGIIATSALREDTALPAHNYDRGFLTLSLQTRPDDLSKVSLIVNGKPFPTQTAFTDTLYTHYVAHIPWDRKTDLSYTFALTDGSRSAGFGASGLTARPGDAQPFVLRAATYRPFTVPNWVEKTVIYQIFPDRFADGDKTNDPPNVVPWNSEPTYYNRFGGDVAGVRQHLDYLSGLGVSAVYFNPVFSSPSNHRYDTTDYKKIDPQFGTNAEFDSLTHQMRERGIRTIMDFAFNHTATNFAAFADLREKGATSAYKDWYFVHSFPIRTDPTPNYDAWYGFPSMPKLNVLNPPTRDFLLGIPDYWSQESAMAGIRLDAANEVDPKFWRALRERVKAHDPQTWILGEVWGDATFWLGGDQWDSVMNYQFRDACLHFVAEGSSKPTEFTNRLMGVYNSYAPQVSRNLMNLLSSHDTPRFLTLCHSDADLDRLAAAIQFTWVGTPSIYYGEEIGMEGGKDPDDRRGMRWDLANDANPMLRYYKRLVAARNASPALQSGDPQILLADDTSDTLAYARLLGTRDAALALVNRSRESRTIRVALPAETRSFGEWIEVISGRRVSIQSDRNHITLQVSANSAAILLPARRETEKFLTQPAR